MEPAAGLALMASVLFMLLGLSTGVWRYSASIRSPAGVAPRYVNIAHRASLMYSFACIVLMQLAQASLLPTEVEIPAVAGPLIMFAIATVTYVLHAALGDTDNQLRKPYRIGRWLVAPGVFEAGGWLLAVGEIAGFLVLATGAAIRFIGGP